MLTKDEAVAAGWRFENDIAEKAIQVGSGLKHLQERAASEEQLLEQIAAHELELGKRK